MTITPREFAEQRSPRRGTANPERMAMAVWEWLVRTGSSAYLANERFGGPSAIEAGPGWCFDRFGCSATRLDDGRVVHIAGEHEDHYDPDFYIYNDVIVRHPDGAVEIYGYPTGVFPPTDFHSATLVGDRIWVVGNLGYPEDRRPGTTPVHALDVRTFAFAAVPVRGEGPGWIHRHAAEPVEDGTALLVRRGVVVTRDAMLDNYDDFLLRLDSGTWTRLTRRPWQQWAVKRVDGEELMLFEMSCAAFDERHPGWRGNREPAAAAAREHHRRIESSGRCFDSEVYENLYAPPIADAHRLPDEDDDLAVRFAVAGARVRYEADMWDVTVKIEGDLSEDHTRAICDDLVRKLALLQRAPCRAVLEGRR